jgi:hypothetical protein
MSDLTSAAEALNRVSALYGITREQLVEVAGGPADGGPHGDGWYPITLADGETTVLMPSIAKVLSLFAGSRGLLKGSWAELEAILVDSEVGTQASVDTADSGTHAEPGVVGPVPNAGTYELIQVGADPKYWKRTGNLLVTDLQAAVAEVQAAIGTVEGIAESVRISSGNLLPDASPSFSMGGGAQPTPGAQWGVTIPAGQVGDTSAQVRLALPYVPQVGAKSTFEVAIETSVPFTRTVYADLVVSTAANPFGVLRATGLTVTPKISGASRIYQYAYEFQGDELGFWPRIQTVTTTPAATEERWEVLGLTEIRGFVVGNAGTASDEMLDSRVPDIMRPIVQPMRVGSGDILPKLGAYVSTSGGAQAGDTPFELVVPAGQTGDTAQVQARWAVDGASLADKRIEIKVRVQPGDSFTRSWSSHLLIVTPAVPTGEFRPGRMKSVPSYEGTALIYTITYHFVGDETGLWYAALLSAGNTPALTEERLSITGFSWAPTQAPDALRSAADLALDGRLSAAIAGSQEYARTIEVGAGGAYPHVEGALASITGASAVGRYRIRFHGTIDGVAELFTKDYVDIAGASRAATYRFRNPDDASAAEIEFSSLAWPTSHTRFSYGNYELENGRYVFHPETAGSGIRDKRVIFFNITARHRGNASAVNNTWSPQSQVPIGAGLSSGHKLFVDASKLIGVGGAFGGHNNVGATEPILIEINDTLLATTTPGLAAMRFAPVGSKQPDLIRINNNSWCGDFVYGVDQGAPWLLTDLADQPAWQNEAEVIGHGNSGLLFRPMGTGVALKIESATMGAGSIVEIDEADPLWPLILGDGTAPRHEKIRGYPGLAGAVLGWGNISGAPVGFDALITNSLAVRLGDRTGAPVAGKIRIDGGAWQTVTMDADFTGQDNPSIVAAIQAQIAGAIVSAYPIDRDFMARLTDEEWVVRNDTGMGYPMRTVLAWDTVKGQNVRPMTAADPVSRLAGVLLERLPPSQIARVKKPGGLLPLSWVRRTDAAAVALGDGLSISTDGQVSKSEAKPVLRAIRGDAFEILGG